jgi:plasmid maintenance system antidote protein VapI
MGAGMPKVKTPPRLEKALAMVAAGAGIATAIKEALEMDVTAFAEEYSVHASNISADINGRRALTDREVDALHARLGGDRAEIVALLSEAMQRHAKTMVSPSSAVA